jgi:hypothetical protein
LGTTGNRALFVHSYGLEEHVKISSLPKGSDIFNVISIKTMVPFFIGIGKNNPKVHMESQKTKLSRKS